MWLLYALAASIVWGIDYVLYERILKHISLTSIYAINGILTTVIWVLLALFSGSFTRDLSTIQHSKNLQLLIATNIITVVLANIFIALSIQSKNAVVAGMVEISYPFFIVLFSWLFFKESHLTIGTFIGGLFIFTGIFILFYLNK